MPGGTYSANREEMLTTESIKGHPSEGLVCKSLGKEDGALFGYLVTDEQVPNHILYFLSSYIFTPSALKS